VSGTGARAECLLRGEGEGRAEADDPEAINNLWMILKVCYKNHVIKTTVMSEYLQLHLNT
jgi:hypothetical protein